ncbi:MAG: hypothetical protein JNL01_03305 [Bdellovibrionales bacterium]|nr:hypothetical protein [Bdellovibrionales bacterium]
MSKFSLKLLNLMAFSFFAAAFTLGTAQANPLAYGNWKYEDYSGSFSKTVYVTIDAQKMIQTEVVGKELLTSFSTEIRFPTVFAIEIQNPTTLAWDAAYDVDVITWKMQWCPRGKKKGCKDFEKMDETFVFLPTGHFVPSDPVRLQIAAMGTQNWTELWKQEISIDPATLFADHTTDSSFGKKSVFEFISPDLAFKVRVEVTSFYTDSEESMGASIYDYGFIGQVTWIDLASNQMVYSQDFESSYGLSFDAEDPNGEFTLNFTTL